MKLKGERELLAEKLYNYLGEEYEKLVEHTANMITKSSSEEDYIKDDGYYINMSMLGEELLMYNKLISTIYAMDLEVYEIRCLLPLSYNNKLLSTLVRVFRDTRLGFSIYNTEDIEKVVRLASHFITDMDNSEV